MMISLLVVMPMKDDMMKYKVELHQIEQTSTVGTRRCNQYMKPSSRRKGIRDVSLLFSMCHYFEFFDSSMYASTVRTRKRDER